MRAAASMLVCAVAACAAPADTRVLVHTGDGMLVAIDPDANGQWIDMPRHDDVTLDVGDRWAAVSVCGYPNAPEVIVQYYRRDDASEVTLACRGALEVTAIPVTLVGATTAIVDLEYGGGLIQDGAGVVYAAHGVWPLGASEWAAADPRVVIQRGVVVDTGTPASLAVDFDRDGFVLDQRLVTVDGSLGNDNIYSTISLDGVTPMNGLIDPFNSPHQVGALPPDRLAADDVQTVTAWSFRADGAEVGENLPLGADPIQVHFPAPLDSGGLTNHGAIDATWTTHEAWDEVLLFAGGGRINSGPQWTVDDYDTENSAITFPRLDSIGGWDPSWNLDLTATTNASLTLYQHVDGGYRAAGWSASFN